jgi:hypothetical protein
VISSFAFNVSEGDYIVAQVLSDITTATLLADTHVSLYKLEGVRGPQGEPGQDSTVPGPPGVTGDVGDKGDTGYGIFGYAKTLGDGTIQGFINMDVTRTSTGVYDYIFLTGTTDTSYGIVGQPFGTVTDTNVQISNVTTSGFTLSCYDSVLVDTEHSVQVFGPPSIVSGSTGGGSGSYSLTTEDNGYPLPNAPVRTLNFVGNVSLVNRGNNKTNVVLPDPTIIIQDEGVDVSNTPHGTINFTGDAVSVTDGGSGITNVTINHQPLSVYGTQFQVVEDLTVSTTTSTTPVTKITLNTPNLPSGTYKVFAHWIWWRSNVTSDALFRIGVNGSSTATTDIRIEAEDATSRYPSSKVLYLNLSGTNTLTLDFWGDSGATTSISDATLEIVRVS